jgi:hypothetical protein
MTTTHPRPRSEEQPPPPSRPTRRATPGWRERPRLLLSILVVIALGVAAWLIFRPRGPSEPSQPLSQCGTVAHAVGNAANGPKRVLLIGDSLLYQPSCGLAAYLSHVGVETHMHAISGSGLLTGKPVWQQQTARLLKSVHPDVVVALFSGNYPPPPVVRDGRPVAVDTPAFFAAWQASAEKISAEVRASGAKLFWVEPPPMVASRRPATTFFGYTRLGDGLLGSGKVLANAEGRWTNTKPQCAGNQPLRAVDSVHLTGAGARVFGQQIAHDLADALHWSPVPAPC